MKPRWCTLLTLAALFILDRPAYSGNPDLLAQFSDALYKQDALKMESIVEGHKGEMPDKIDKLIETALKPELTKEEREQKFYILERLATVYKDITGELAPLKMVKKRSFESRLTPAVVSTEAGGLHVVETISTETIKNLFSPDNIIISSGDTVRWDNKDATTHLLASVLTSVGEGGLFSARVEPGQSWQYKFNTPGEYYYICFIHKIMYGKVLVRE